MRILLGYSYYQYQVDVKEWVNAWLKRVSSELDIQIDSFCLTLNPPGPRLTWMEIEKKWDEKDPCLMKMYNDLAHTVQKYDAFINWNGINLHPEFVKKLKTYTVFGCFDDPETSEDLSMPVATSYDLCLVGNIAEIDSYKKWGVKNVEWWPMGFHAEDYDPDLTEDKILNGNRTNDITLLCERTSGWRKERLDKFSQKFPHGTYYGNGWDRGFLPENEKKTLLQNTKIGPNFHNSTGPINFRTFILPANGVMQICDNKSHLGKIFEIGKEVVGFDTIEECMELTEYYLQHDEERQKIAAAGWKRAVRDYNEVAVFKLAIEHIKKGIKNKVNEQQEKVEWTNREVSNFWDYESQFPQNYFTFCDGERIVDNLAVYFKDAKIALDYGSGPGFFIPHLLKKNIQVIALNFSSDYMKMVNRIYKWNYLFKGAVDLEEVRSSGKKFDIITAIEVVERINEFYLKEMMADIKNLLSDKGVAIITVPNKEDFPLSRDWQHVRFWSKEIMVEHVEKQGLEIVDIFATKFAKRCEYAQNFSIPGIIRLFFEKYSKKNNSKCLCEKQSHLVFIVRNKN